MNKDIDKVISKINKLKKLQESASNINSEGEANAAAFAIKNLLLEYNLKLEEVLDSGEKSRLIEERRSGYTFKSIGGRWESSLYNVLCEFNFCKCLQGNSYKNLHLIGNEENIETVKWLHDFLSKKFVRLSNERFKKFKETEEYLLKKPSRDKFQRNYLLGCVQGLKNKFETEKQNLVSEEKMTSLVLVKNNEIDLYLKEKYNFELQKRVKYINADSSFELGYEDGKDIKINEQIK